MKVQNINISQENIFQISNNPLDIVTKINSKVSLSKEELKILVNQIKVEENREKRIEYVDLLDEVSNNQGEIFENVLSDLEKLVENKDEVLVDKILGIFYGLSFGNDKLKIKNIASKQHEYDQLSNTKQDLHGYLASLANNHYQKQQEVKANIVQNQNLKSEIVQKTNTIDDLNKKFDESQKNVQALNQKINEINYKCTQTIYQTKSTQEEVKILNAKISQIKGEYVDKIKSVTNQERALLFSESVDKPDQIHKTAIDIIKLTGFDPNYLAYIAIDKNRADLFELSIKSGANFRNCFINGKTLFQHAVNNDNFASKIVLAEQNLDVTLIQSMRSKDYLTIDKLLQLKPDVVTKTVNGYSPLQVAVIYEDYKLTQKFIEKNIASISTLSSENESVFKVALRSSNEEIVNLLLTKVDLVKEISELVRTNEIELVKKVLDLHEFPHNTIQQLLSTASNSSFNELEKIFIEKGGKLEEVQRIAHQEQQEPLIQLKDNFYLAMLNFNVNKFFTDQIQDNIYILGDQFTNIIENIYEIN